MSIDKGVTRTLTRISGLGVKVGEPLSRYTSIRVGGPADYLLEPTTRSALIASLAVLRDHGVPVWLLGNGSNVLVSDLGVRGAVLRLRGVFRRVSWGQRELTVGAACAVSRLVREAVRRGLGGLEFAEGIPGSVGGSLVMNAGAYGSEMEKVVRRVEGVSLAGVPLAFGREKLRFSYRQTELPADMVVTQVKMALTPESIETIDRRMREIMARRKQSQPFGYPNCGSVFRNPPGDYAGRLIEAAGLKGRRVGRAEVARQHANFILNLGGARARDVRELIELIRAELKRRYQVELATEIHFVGEWSDRAGAV